MLGSNETFATAGSRFSLYGGEGGLSEWRYEFIRCTKVVFPDPAIPIVMITIGFFVDSLDEVEAMMHGLVIRKDHILLHATPQTPTTLVYFNIDVHTLQFTQQFLIFNRKTTQGISNNNFTDKGRSVEHTSLWVPAMSSLCVGTRSGSSSRYRSNYVWRCISAFDPVDQSQ